MNRIFETENLLRRFAESTTPGGSDIHLDDFFAD
jgi:hypothetical protein